VVLSYASMVVALVPIRLEPVAKRRLAHVLPPRERRLIVLDWFQHVTTVLADAGLDVVVLAPHAVPEDAHELWLDRRSGLEAAVADGVVRAGAPVLVVHADLPHLGVADVDAMLSSDADVVIARSRDGGTNAALLRRPFRLRFGGRSALRNAHRARAAGLRAVVLDRPGLALDVDDEAALLASSKRD
jgi:2-phospho-L-lactate guanylyltransferase